MLPTGSVYKICALYKNRRGSRQLKAGKFVPILKRRDQATTDGVLLVHPYQEMFQNGSLKKLVCKDLAKNAVIIKIQYEFPKQVL